MGVHHYSKGGQALLSVVLGILCSVFQDPAAAVGGGDLVHAHENNNKSKVYTQWQSKRTKLLAQATSSTCITD